MATYTPTRLAGLASQLPTSAGGGVYSGPAGGAIIKQIVFNNSSASAVTVSAFIGGTANANAFISALSVAPNSQIIWSSDIPISSGEVLYMTASAGTSISYIVSGIVIS